MASSLKFVDYTYSKTGGDAGNVLLDISSGDYCVDEIDLTPAEPRMEWRDPAHGNGREMSYHKYENREVVIRMHIYGDDREELAENIRAAWECFLADQPILEWISEGFAAPLYIDLVSPPMNIDPQGWNEAKWRENDKLIVFANLEITCEAKPFLRAPEEIFPFCQGLGLNDSFERRSAHDFNNWTESVSGAGNTITANVAQYIDGAVSLTMTMGAVAGNCTIVDTDYIPVDEDHHYNIKAFFYEHSGAPSVDVNVACYDDANNLLGTLAILANYNPGAATTWLDGIKVSGEPIIYPSSSGDAPKWPAGTTKIKRTILNDAVNSVVSVDKCYFGDSEYICGYEMEGAFGISVPDDIMLGDVPSPLDLYIEHYATSGIFDPEVSGVSEDLNDVHALDSTHIWACGDDGTIVFSGGSSWASQASGVTTDLNGIYAFDSSNAWAVGDSGVIRFWGGANWAAQTYPAATELAVDGGLETWTNPTTLTNWTATVSYGTWQGQFGGGVQHAGTWCAGGIASPNTIIGINIVSNAFITVNTCRQYSCSAWIKNTGAEPGWFYYRVNFYDSSSVLLGWKDIISNANSPANTWAQKTGTLLSTDFPVGTVKVKLEMIWYGDTGDTPTSLVYMDDISFKEDISAIQLNDVYAQASNNVYAVGNCGHVLNYAGVAWAEQTSGVDTDLNDVHGVDANHVFAVGDAGVILFRHNAGAWAAQASGTVKNLYGVHCEDATHTWAVGEDGTILFTADMGTTWVAQTSPTSEDLLAVSMASATVGWAVGANGTIVKTADGSTWAIQGSGTTVNLNGVSTVSTSVVYIVGDAYDGSGVIFKGEASVANIPLTNLIIGQRLLYSASYAPVCEAPTSASNLWTRRYQDYRSIGSATAVDFGFIVEAHKGRVLPSLGFTFSASTAYDKLNLTAHLETLAGTDMTTTVSFTQLDAGDPNTNWKEEALLSTRWSPFTVPTHFVADEADDLNIKQKMTITSDGSLACNMYLDQFTLIPIDRSYVEVSTAAYNFIIFDSKDCVVLQSLDGSLETAAMYPRGYTKGLPQFEADPDGVNIAVIAVNTVTNDQRLTPLINVIGRYDPLFLIVPDE